MMALQFTENHTFCFVWKIENLKFNGWRTPKGLASPPFHGYGSMWVLLFFPRGHSGSANYLSCYLHRHEGNNKIPLRFRIELINKAGKKQVSREKEFCNKIRDGFDRYFKYTDYSNYDEIAIICWIYQSEPESSSTKICRVDSKLVFDRCCFLENFEIQEHSLLNLTTEKLIQIIPEEIKVVINVDKDRIHVSAKTSKMAFINMCYMECRISALDTLGSEQILHCAHLKFNTLEIFGYTFKPEFLSENSKYVKNHKITLKFEFCISTERMTNEIVYGGPDIAFGDASKYIAVKDNTNSNANIKAGKHLAIKDNCDKNDVPTIDDLVEDLRRMYATHLQADVTLQAGDQTFKAHKLLLSARSPVFATMFHQEMLEKQTGIIKILDVEANILNRFLEYLYTGMLETLDYTSATKLLLVADKYQVTSLKEKCATFLMKNLSTENACDVAVMADMLGHESLKTCTVDYIVSNAEVVLTSEEWMKFLRTNSYLTTEIFCKLSSSLHAKCKSGE